MQVEQLESQLLSVQTQKQEAIQKDLLVYIKAMPEHQLKVIKSFRMLRLSLGGEENPCNPCNPYKPYKPYKPYMYYSMSLSLLYCAPFNRHNICSHVELKSLNNRWN